MTEEEKQYYQAQQTKFNSLHNIEQDCWERISRGALSSRDDFHQPVVATISGDMSSLRTVVLRNAWSQDKKVAFHTDTRSGKIHDIALNNNISWLFYSQRHRVQIRLGGKAEIQKNTPFAEESWQKALGKSVKCYVGETAPGTISLEATSGLPEKYANREPTRTESKEAINNFAVVVTQVMWMEWLWLNSRGHLRAQFVYNGDNTFKSNWLVP